MPRRPEDPAAPGMMPPAQGPGMPGPGMPAPGMPGPMAPGIGPMPMDPMQGAIPEPPVATGPPVGPPPGPQDPTGDLPVDPPEADIDLDDLQPIYPKRMYDRKTGELKKKKKVTRAYMEAAVNDDQMRYQALINRFAEDLRTYRMMDRTIFDDLKRDDLELYASAMPAIEVHKMCNMVSGIEHVVQFPYRTDKEQKQAQRMENAVYEFLKRANTIHRNAGNTALKWEWLFSHGIFGRMITRVLPDSDPDFPWDIRVFDPSTCYLTWGGKGGLVRASLVYNESLDKILQTYVDDPNVNKKLIKKYTDEETGKLNLNYVGEVKECWTEWERWLEFDGEDIIPVTEHNIGKVPFAFTIAPGQMGSANMPDGESTQLEISTLLPLSNNNKFADMDMTQKGLSFFHHQRPALRQQAAMMSLNMTAAKQRLNPPVFKESPYEDPGDPISMTTGDTSYGRPGEKVTPLLSQGNAMDMGVFMTANDKELQKAGLPDHLFGAMEGSNISGFAVESMIASAKDRIQPYINDLEEHMEDVIELMMYEYQNFGHLLVDDDEGRWYFAHAGRGDGGGLGSGPSRPQFDQMMGMLMQMTGGVPPDLAAWQMMGMDTSQIPEPEDEDNYLSRADILAIGHRPEIKLQSVHMQNMTMLANVASMLIDKKIWSRERAMDEFNIKNPQQEFDRILKEDAMTNPKMMELVVFPEALFQSGDMSGFFAYFATVIAPILMQMQAGAPPGAAPPDSGGGPSTAQGDSQPMMGQGPGSPSGPGNAAPPGGD